MATCVFCTSPMLPGTMLCRKCGSINASETGNIRGVSQSNVVPFSEIKAAEIQRVRIGGRWDTVFGGGLVPTSCILFSGMAGGGKTTILLQKASRYAEVTGKVAYMFSAEQASEEVKITIERLQIPNPDRIMGLKEFGAGAEIDEELFKKHPPCLIILDSVSALCGKDTHAALEVIKRYKKYSVKYRAATFLICHMNKEGDMAGLYSLQHEVDTLVTISPADGDDPTCYHHPDFRKLDVWKNRYGPACKENWFQMTSTGLMDAPEPPEKKNKKKMFVEVPPVVEAAPEPPPREKRAAKPAPDEIKVDGQRLVRKKKDTSRAKAVEGEALKRRRPVMPRTREGKQAAVKRRAKNSKSKRSEARA